MSISNSFITISLLGFAVILFSNSSHACIKDKVAQEKLAQLKKEPDELSQLLATRIIPEPIKRVHPKYPMSAARQGREGWAVVSFVIDEEGGVNDIIVKETSGSKDFARATKKAVKRWKYKPAIENGKPIQQCVNMVQLDFRMGGEGTLGVTRRFKGKYNKAKEALETKDFEEFNKQIASIKKNVSMHLSEYNYLHLLIAEYQKVQGNKKQQLNHLRKVAKASTRLASKEQQLSTLYQVFVLEVELSKYRAAFETYNQLEKMDEAKPHMKHLDEVLAKVKNVISGDKNIIRQGSIKKDFWSASLVRHEFSLVDIKGNIDSLDVRCANKRHIYDVKENSTWVLPTSWKSCDVYVHGDDDASFSLVEHPVTSS
ncbi:energy transducer TonB [Litorilituus lipolyticus]|uniref:Energy transducer TonB n=1 Tax=Litorilituus lipolyticus TaxID=2491017 RepID=A0A502L2H7_9GAMM|nr:energy transducer TonB [Litorilituus lipolyticus]TPH16193.1 energy transducer TonB [Litorilituus lipolyticus]